MYIDVIVSGVAYRCVARDGMIYKSSPAGCPLVGVGVDDALEFIEGYSLAHKVMEDSPPAPEQLLLDLFDDDMEAFDFEWDNNKELNFND